ncbi:MAG: c-type cytochrome [Pseudomonadota bacterium]
MSKSPNALVLLGGAGIVAGVGLAVVLSQGGSADRDAAAALRSQAAEAEAAAQAKLADLKIEIAAADGVHVPLSLGDPLPEMRVAVGRAAHAEEVASWDIDVRPDGTGLPVGSGDVWTGEEVFVAQCAHCHGDFGEAVGRWPVLAGGHDTLADEHPVKTIGSYWPYLSTVYDYINRAMPFGNAQSLSADEVYAITAYLLYVNDLVDDDFELSNETFFDVALPNEENFFLDDRAETELAAFSTEPCMSDCKPAAEITMRAAVIDVTPEEEGAAEAEATADTSGAELIAAGEKVFRKCASCHAIGDGARNKAGPLLTGVMGRSFAGVDGFSYSAAFSDAAAEGRVWDEASMVGFLKKPKDFLPGTKMGFAGLSRDKDLDAILAYLKTFSPEDS